MSIRIGFYICHCGINIAHRVRVTEVAAFIGQLRDVVVARDYKFMCSDPGQAMIEKDITELGLNRVVVASCSPRLHGKTFMAACRRAGLNPYYFQMASVREQVSWVTADEDEATAKAKTLAAAAVARVRFHHRLETRYAAVHPDVLVIGGGIAGMQAALDIADGNLQVHLIERDTTIGGHMLQFDKTFPTLDCAACIGTPKMVDVSQHANIHLHSLSEVVEVSGFVGNYTVKILKSPAMSKRASVPAAVSAPRCVRWPSPVPGIRAWPIAEPLAGPFPRPSPLPSISKKRTVHPAPRPARPVSMCKVMCS